MVDTSDLREEIRDTFGAWADVIDVNAMALALTLRNRSRLEREVQPGIYPPDSDIFRALQLTQPANVKAVIFGQDPYHEAGQANGLAFSVSPGVTIPPSLRNIFKELDADIGIQPPKDSNGRVVGDLTAWAQHGVLLLNSVLTVPDGKANGHKGWDWQTFTSAVIRACDLLPQPLMFICWGGQARAACAGRDLANTQHSSIWSTHPSPLSANRSTEYSLPAFIGSRPFSKANAFLSSHGAAPVDWNFR